MNRTARSMRPLAVATLLAWGWVALVTGCAGLHRVPRDVALRISDVEDRGDPRRRASTQLVVEGLEAEMASRAPRALSRYQDAIRIDPGNPFAYLALARYYAASGDSVRALERLDRARSLLDPQAALYRNVEPHLVGLRGWALAEGGQSTASEPLLAEARRLAPSVWHDGRLGASELR